MSAVEDARRNAELEAEARRRGLQPWQIEAERAVGDGLMADIVADSRRSSPVVPRSITERPDDHRPTATRGNGWVDPKPLGSPAGINMTQGIGRRGFGVASRRNGWPASC
jgi:hypothetical protein